MRRRDESTIYESAIASDKVSLRKLRLRLTLLLVPPPVRRGTIAQTVTGSGLSASILYCLIARVMSFGVILPALASAQMAACAT